MALGSLGIAVEGGHAATDTFYALSSVGYLYQIDVNTSTFAATTTLKQNLSTWVTTSGTDFHAAYSGLAIDTSTGDIYFSYSYNSSSSSSSTGIRTVVPYVYQNVGGVYQPAHTLGAAVTSTTLGDVAGGWLASAAYYSGAYYAGINASDTLLKLAITGTTSKSYSSATQTANFDNTSTTSLTGGDFVIGSTGTIYGTTVTSGGNTFFRQTVGSASAWTTATAPAASLELTTTTSGGSGYALSTATGNLYTISSMDATPTFTLKTSGAVSSSLNLTDLSVISGPLAALPEPSTILGAAAATAAVGAEGFRRRRQALLRSHAA